MSLILAFVCVIAIQIKYSSDNSSELSYSLLLLLVYVFSALIINSALNNINKKALIYASVLGFVFSILEVIGTSVFRTYTIPEFSILTIISMIGFCILFTSILLFFLAHFKILQEWLFEHDVFKHNRILFKPNISYFIIVWIFIILAWMPSYIASFPGVFSYDAPHQFSQFYTMNIGNNQPVLSSGILFYLISFGKYVFGTYEGGLAFYIALQIVFCSMILAYSSRFISKLEIPNIVQISVVLFFALFPVNHLFAVNATKDVPFSFLVALLIIFILEIIYDSEKFFTSLLLQIRFCLIVTLMLFFRNTGIYIFLMFIPVFLITFRKRYLKIIIICLLCILPYKIITGPLYTYYHIPQSNISEAFSIPVQQMANAFINNKDNLTNVQNKLFYDVMPNWEIKEYQEKYHPRNSDYIRPQFNTDKFSENPMIYLKNYVSIGIDYPVEYIDALLNNTLGYWYPEMILPDESTYPQKYIEYTNSTYPGIEMMTNRYDFIPILSEFYKKIGEDGAYAKIPILSMFFSIGFISWLTLICGAVFCYNKKYMLLLPIWLLFSVWCTSFVGPVVLLRYVYSLFLCLPIIIAVMFEKGEGYLRK